MLVWTLLFFICLSLRWNTASTANIDTLKSVQILFRHGARERDAGFEQPTGQLKPTGKKQMYDLGIFFRQRYGGLLKDVFDENEIQIISSDVGRTIQSASLVAFGLYKDFNAAASWNGEGEEKVSYEPIPVRSIPKKYDKYIQNFPDCPRLSELVDESSQAYYGRYAQENRELIDYYYKETGDETVRDSSDGIIEQFTEMMVQSEQVLFNISNKIPLSDWAEPLKSNIAFLSIKSGFYRECVNTLEKRRINAGPLIQLLTANMDEAVASRKKMYLFSGHDRILTYLLEVLGIYDPDVPNMSLTGNSLMVELHEDPELESRSFIQFLFRNSTEHEPYLLEMQNCGKPCYLSEFKQLTNEFIPTDFEAECASQKNSNLKSERSPRTLNKMNMTFLATFIIIALVAIVVFQIVLIKRRSYVRLG